MDIHIFRSWESTYKYYVAFTLSRIRLYPVKLKYAGYRSVLQTAYLILMSSQHQNNLPLLNSVVQLYKIRKEHQSSKSSSYKYTVAFGGTTNVYFPYELICILFSWLIDVLLGNCWNFQSACSVSLKSDMSPKILQQNIWEAGTSELCLKLTLAIINKRCWIIKWKKITDTKL